MMANWAAYKARYLSTELGESKWIAMAMGSLLQLLLVAIPILFLVRDNPSAKYFVSTSIVFVITMSILGFIFVPKIIAHYERKKERNLKRNLRRHSAVCMPSESSASNPGNGLKFNLVVSFVCSRKLLQCVRMIASLSLTPVCFCINPYSLQQSAKAQIELDEYKGKVASLKEAIEEHGLDANSLFAQAGIETDGNEKD